MEHFVKKNEVIELIKDAFNKYNQSLNNIYCSNLKPIQEENKISRLELLTLLKNKQNIIDTNENEKNFIYIKKKLNLQNDDDLILLPIECINNLKTMLHMLDLNTDFNNTMAISYGYDAIVCGIYNINIINAIHKILKL